MQVILTFPAVEECLFVVFKHKAERCFAKRGCRYGNIVYNDLVNPV